MVVSSVGGDYGTGEELTRRPGCDPDISICASEYLPPPKSSQRPAVKLSSSSKMHSKRLNIHVLINLYIDIYVLYMIAIFFGESALISGRISKLGNFAHNQNLG